MQSPEVWADKNLSSKLGGEIKEIKDNLDMLKRWTGALDDAEAALEIQDAELITEGRCSQVNMMRRIRF